MQTRTRSNTIHSASNPCNILGYPLKDIFSIAPQLSQFLRKTRHNKAETNAFSLGGPGLATFFWTQKNWDFAAVSTILNQDISCFWSFADCQLHCSREKVSHFFIWKETRQIKQDVLCILVLSTSDIYIYIIYPDTADYQDPLTVSYLSRVKVHHPTDEVQLHANTGNTVVVPPFWRSQRQNVGTSWHFPSGWLVGKPRFTACEHHAYGWIS